MSCVTAFGLRRIRRIMSADPTVVHRPLAARIRRTRRSAVWLSTGHGAFVVERVLLSMVVVVVAVDARRSTANGYLLRIAGAWPSKSPGSCAFGRGPSW